MPRNIDHQLLDARFVTHIANSDQPMKWSEKIIIGQTVHLQISDIEGITVSITDAANENSTYRGTVLHGFWTEDEATRIDEGEMVEFSRKKICGVITHK